MDTPLTVDTVLVPVDGSDESTTAVEYAAAIATEYDATLHAIYVFGESAARAIDAGMVADEDAIAESDSFFDAIANIAADAGVPFSHSVAIGFSTERKLVHPGSVVLDAADQMHADFLVIPRESARDTTADVLEKTAEYVLLYASQPVLSV